MHFKSDRIEVMIDNKTNEIINELFGSHLARNKIDLEISWKVAVLFFIVLMECITNVIE